MGLQKTFIKAGETMPFSTFSLSLCNLHGSPSTQSILNFFGDRNGIFVITDRVGL
jgi:hypothetical protein